MTGVVLTGIGGALPDNHVSNADLAGLMDTSDEWIRGRTGIAGRYWSRTTSTGDLAVAAGRRALDSAQRDEVDLVVLATTTPDHPCPATAPAVAARLGLGPVGAFDVAAVCSGFVYALAVAKGFLAGGLARSALVIGAETYSTILDREDRSTAVIFGDGAGAVVLCAAEPGTPASLEHIDLGSNGEDRQLVWVPGGGSYERTHPGADRSTRFAMLGREVFRTAVTRMAQSSEAVLRRSGWTTADLDWIVGHQANERILGAVADRLAADRSKLIMNLDRVGNTSAASIPLALLDAVTSGLLAGGDRLLLTAFGGGTTWGSATLVWPEVKAEPADLIPT
ncbi:beta-ketoacyl-ACP synthase III [Amycolatopsis australiensis]|uniref:Beta-ketoacyl-[acyl-carrier-protein] synthase III n=1 Tax=Amycolatopsis australiensis TaxID=546364 RepID=A0A1K1S2U7_9PSEU|nr:beta-ketoacyl-ACP synthase III [Amycolatopsis australiensis]SFW78675.1 3-oxoacyl-[acyl-carrier-protein] synthase-3 [Amycolatopsis australiensis]